MRVRDLIAALADLDLDLPVVMPSGLGPDFVEIDRVILDVMAPGEGAGLLLCDYDDDGCLTVVRMFEAGDHDDRDERPKPLTS